MMERGMHVVKSVSNFRTRPTASSSTRGTLRPAGVTGATAQSKHSPGGRATHHVAHSYRMRRSSSTPNLSRLTGQIFSTGKLLHTIQMSNLYQDSKTFVDMATKLSEDEVLSNFEKLGETPSLDELRTFVSENFHESGY